MAILLPSSYFKIAVLSTGVLSVAAATVRFTGPFVLHFATSYFPIIYNNVVFFLRPPYLYLVINCIIISIVASSKLRKYPSSDVDHYFSEAEAEAESEAPLLVPVNVTAYERAYSGFVENNVPDDARDNRTAENARRSPEVVFEKITSDGGDELRNSEETKPSSGSTELSVSKEPGKPPASARLGQRKAVKSSPKGGNKTAAWGVSQPGRLDTLDSLDTTWKKITESLSTELKKSDTWDMEISHVGSSEHNQNHQRMTISENLIVQATTTNERLQPPSGWLMREPSPGQEELNRRVEAFIKKFNEDMRLQRKESLAKHQKKMVNNGCLH